MVRVYFFFIKKGGKLEIEPTSRKKNFLIFWLKKVNICRPPPLSSHNLFPLRGGGGYWIVWFVTWGLSSRGAIAFSKTAINYSDKPQLMLAFNATIRFNSSVVKCSFFETISKTFWKIKKSARFWPIIGNFSKWSKIFLKSLIELTL